MMNLTTSSSSDSVVSNTTLTTTSAVNTTTPTILTTSVNAVNTTTLTTSVNAVNTTTLTTSVNAVNTTTLTTPVNAVNTTTLTTSSPASAVASSSTTTLASSTTTTDSVVSSTTIPVYDYGEFSCQNMTDPNVIVNSTSVAEGTVIRASCPSSYTLVVTKSNNDIFQCLGGRWIPLMPKCAPAGNAATDYKGVIIGCVIGGVVCLVLVIVAIYMLRKSMKERKEQQARNKEFYDKMDQIGSYINASFQDSVGMPVLTMDTRDTGLRGRVSQTNNNASSASEKEEPPDAVQLGADLF